MKRTHLTLRYERKKQKYKYYLVKTLTRSKCLLTLDKKSHKEQLERYDYIWKNKFSLDKDNSLAPSFSYTPSTIIISELISKDDLPKVHAGLKKLLRKHTSHKFIGGVTFKHDIDELVSSLNATLTSGESWNRVDRFDFENRARLKKYISYFDVSFRNFSSSYFVIEMWIYLSNEEKQSLQKLIKSNYTDSKQYVNGYYSNNNKKSGAKIFYSPGGYCSEYMKSELLYEEIQSIKYRFLKYLNNFFPFILFQEMIPISINVFATNIHYSEPINNEFWLSVGVDTNYGMFLSENEKIYFKTILSTKFCSDNTDMIFIYNCSKPPELGYQNIEANVMDYLFYQLNDFYKLLMLKNITNHYTKICIKYRNIINKIKIKRYSYIKLLKIKYNFDLDFNIFNKIIKEINLDKESKKANDFVKSNCLPQCSPWKSYKLLTESPIYSMNTIDQNRNKLNLDIDNKINIAQNLFNYKNEKNTKKVNFAMLTITTLTFLLIIFPQWANFISNHILNIFYVFMDFIQQFFID